MFLCLQHSQQDSVVEQVGVLVGSPDGVHLAAQQFLPHNSLFQRTLQHSQRRNYNRGAVKRRRTSEGGRIASSNHFEVAQLLHVASVQVPGEGPFSSE